MIYFAYTDNGAFDGFYNDEIHDLDENFITNNCIKINEELWKSLLSGIYKVNLDLVNSYKEKVCTLEDKDELFIENSNKEFKPEKFDNTDILSTELARTKIALMKQQNINKNLLEQIAKLKIEISGQNKINENILKEIENLKGGN